MPKTFVFDTSVLIHNTNSYKNFSDSEIIIPIAVLEELDKLKKFSNEVGRNARVVIKTFDELSSNDDITKGVQLNNNSIIKIDVNNYPLSKSLKDPTYGDTRILNCAINIAKKNDDVTLVSNDINLRVKAKAFGLHAISYNDSNKAIDLYTGIKTIINENAGNDLKNLRTIDESTFDISLNENECVVFENQNEEEISYGRKIQQTTYIKTPKKILPWNISPRNKEQTLAIDLLMDNTIRI